MERCPVCNARLSGVMICPRCQADLTLIFANAQQAEFWYQQALQFRMLHEVPIAIIALIKALRCKQTPVAFAFREVICKQQYPQLLNLLAQQQFSDAEQLLDLLDTLGSHKQLNYQLRAFCHYLHLQKRPS